MSDRRGWNVLLSHPAMRYPKKVGCQSDRIATVRHLDKVERWPDRIPNVRHPGGMSYVARRKGGSSACARCRDPSSWWHVACIAIWSNSIRTPQEDTWHAPLSGLPQGEALTSHPDDSISYSDMLSGLLTEVSKPCYVIPTACHSPRSAACRAKGQEWWQVTSHDIWQSSVGWWWPCHHLEASWRAKKSSHH